MRRAAIRFLIMAGLLLLGACGGSSGEVSSNPVGDAAAPVTGADAGSDDAGPVGNTPEAPIATESISSRTAIEPTTNAPDTMIGEAAADLVALVGGGQLDLNSIEGQDTVLWFWAPW